MHTIAIEYDSMEGQFALREVADDGSKREVIEWHTSFADAQQHACMLLSETGDVRISIKPQEFVHQEYPAPGANDA